MIDLEKEHWFPQTKIYPPRAGEDTLERSHLIWRIHEAATARRLTLISAPAGSGKTNAAAALGHAAPKVPLAWLTLDENHNDPATFLTVFFAALRRVCPDLGANTQTLLESLPDPGAEFRV